MRRNGRAGRGRGEQEGRIKEIGKRQDGEQRNTAGGKVRGK